MASSGGARSKGGKYTTNPSRVNAIKTARLAKINPQERRVSAVRRGHAVI